MKNLVTTVFKVTKIIQRNPDSRELHKVVILGIYGAETREHPQWGKDEYRYETYTLQNN